MTRRGSAAVAALVAVIGTAGWIASAQQAPDAESLTFLGEPITAAQLAGSLDLGLVTLRLHRCWSDAGSV